MVINKILLLINKVTMAFQNILRLFFKASIFTIFQTLTLIYIILSLVFSFTNKKKSNFMIFATNTIFIGFTIYSDARFYSIVSFE